MVELTFILQKGEKILKEASSLQYAGVSLITSGSAFGTEFGNSGIGGGLYSGKQEKREGSIWDAKFVHLYVTNKRIILCNAKKEFFSNKEKSVGNLLSEIEYKNIKGINSNSKLGNPAIDVSVAGKTEIDNVKFWFLNTEAQRVKVRDEFLALIKKQI